MSQTEKTRIAKHRVNAIEEIGEGVFILSFEKLYDFIPGQIIAIYTDHDDRAPRLYSILSGKDEKEMSILFNIVPAGKLSGLLSKLGPGDNIYSSRPYGRFIGSEEPSVWIATGTGIAPFISMIRSGNSDNKYLIHGGRENESFYFHDELKKLMGKRYIRCSSTLKDTEHYTGRVTNYLSHLKELQMNSRYYLCGSAEMVVEARDILISRGIPFNKIESEIYF